MHNVAVRAAARLSVASAVAALATTGALLAPSAEAVAPGDGSVAPGAARAEHTASVRAHREAVRERRARRAQVALESRGQQVVSLASQEAGDPYVWGAAGPDSFDCSGFTQYVFAQVGIELPHSSSAQAALATPVSDPQPGDLVFFSGSGGIYHVAIYAGDGQIWHAPRSGDVVSLEPMWTTSGVSYGRVA